MPTEKNILLLKRAKEHYQAGFYIVKNTLEELHSKVPSFLHPKEIEHVNGLKFDRRKHSYLLGRYTAKKALAQLFPEVPPQSIWIDAGIFQFPIVKCPHLENIQVSISHCQDICIVLAFPEAHPLGIDIEFEKAVSQETIQKQITPTESNILTEMSLNTPKGHIMLWTVKEAISKTLRTGMTMNFKVFEVKSIKADKGIFESHYLNSIQYKALSSLFGEFAISMVLPRKTEVDLGIFWEAVSCCLRN